MKWQKKLRFNQGR